MLKRFLLKACLGAALAGALLAQVPSTAPAQGQPDGARQTLPGWRGTQPLQPGQAPLAGGGLVAASPGRWW